MTEGLLMSDTKSSVGTERNEKRSRFREEVTCLISRYGIITGIITGDISN